MLYDEKAVRDSIRNREGRRVFYLGHGDQLTSAARDWLGRQRIDILPADQARPDRYRLLSGGTIDKKPEHMTHLNGDLLVPKDHPRILFRGKMDTLESELLLCQLEAPETENKVREVLDLARKIIRWEVLEEPAEGGTLCGLSEEQQREISHFPQKTLGIPHFMPEKSDGIAILRLNRARCAAREAELAAVTAFRDREGNPTRCDLLRLLNRMSSMLYILMLETKAGTL